MNRELYEDHLNGLAISELSRKYKVSRTRVYKEIAGTCKELRKEMSRSEEILQKYYHEGITLDSVRALKKERNDYKEVLDIIKEKCLHTDNLNYMAVCINYDMYKEKMSKKHDTEVVKIDWDDKVLIDYLRLLTKEEFDLLKEWQRGAYIE